MYTYIYILMCVSVHVCIHVKWSLRGAAVA